MIKLLGFRVEGIGFRWRKIASRFFTELRPSLKPDTYHLTPNRGYSLVEVLIAITVLLIALVGPLTIAHSGLKRANFSKEQTQAIFLAQEGIEGVVKLREDRALSATSYGDLNQVWGNMTALNSLCPSSGSERCGVTVSETGTIDIYRCGSCGIKYDSSWRVPYKQGVTGGLDTKYTRELQINVNDTYAQVWSNVSWGSEESQQVTLETFIYNIYYEQ